MKLSISMTRKEAFWGFTYLIIQFMVLPFIISAMVSILPTELNDAQLNFLYYCVNFAAIAVIFRKFLWQNLERMSMFPGYLFKVALFGLARYLALNALVGAILLKFVPDYINANDTAIAEMVQSELTLIAAGTILLVPLAEECMFRGLIFGNLYQKSPVAAYLVSTIAFSVIHLVSYVGVYTPTELLVSFLSYLPAGLCLGWAYVKADTIFAPILIHAAVNAMGIYGMR